MKENKKKKKIIDGACTTKHTIKLRWINIFCLNCFYQTIKPIKILNTKQGFSFFLSFFLPTDNILFFHSTPIFYYLNFLFSTASLWHTLTVIKQRRFLKYCLIKSMQTQHAQTTTHCSFANGHPQLGGPFQMSKSPRIFCCFFLGAINLKQLQSVSVVIQYIINNKNIIL